MVKETKASRARAARNSSIAHKLKVKIDESSKSGRSVVKAKAETISLTFEQALKEAKAQGWPPNPLPVVIPRYITSEVASELLDHNCNNRTVRPGKVEQYMRMMEEDQWIAEAGITITVDKNGDLVDGQHRLWSIVMSGKAQWVNVAYSPLSKEEIFSAFDKNIVRELQEQLKILGVDNPREVGTLARHIWMHDNFGNGRMWIAGRASSEELLLLGQELSKQSATEIAFENYRSIRNAVKCGDTFWIVAIYLIARDSAHVDRLEEFKTGVFTGANLPLKDPRLALRNTLLRTDPPMSPKMTRTLAGMTIIQWNKWLRGEESTRAVFKPTQNFPTPL